MSATRSLFASFLPRPAPVPSGWAVACGQVNHLTDDFTWRDEGFAVTCTQPAFSPQQRFVIAGDVWLSNRAWLLRKLNQPTGHRSSTGSGSDRVGLLIHDLQIHPVATAPGTGPPGDSARPDSGESQCSHELTDAQIIAALWEREGTAAVLRLEGMFAFVVFDRQQKQVWLVRDRVGARTLYYSLNGTTRWIAPQLRTVSQRLSPDIDPVALRDYLCCAFVPGERTMWSGIRELRPGTWRQMPDDETTTYWQVREQIEGANQPLEWHAARLRAQLDQVINEYLPEGEPVGDYISGGLDSSCEVSLEARLHTQPVHTYSIHFGDETPHELEFSSLVADHCRTTHHIIEIKVAQMWNLLPETMGLLDDPIGDPLTVPNLMLGRAARQSVSVILNGEGGDPCFGGPKNQPMLLDGLYRSAPESAERCDLVSAYLTSFQKCAPDLSRLLKPDIWQSVRDEPSVFAPELAGDGSFLNRLMFINTKFKGADHILTKVSNLTQSCGLSGRSPLFDQRIVNLSLTIPPAFKLSGAAEKAVLKAAVSDLLPERILARPKSGMMVPVQLWFRKYWQRQARALLLDRQARIREFLNQDLIRDWLDYRGETWGRYGVRLWLLVSLELWLRSHR